MCASSLLRSCDNSYEPDDFPVAYREYQRLVSLPLYPRMSDRDVGDVIEAVGEVVRKYKR
jgi:dTDP-4-amino-4,6-dideoxygalactose transaminase